MTEEDREQFYVLIGGLGETHRVEVTDGMLRGYWWALGDHELCDIAKAAKRAIRILKWMPKPSELRDLAYEARRRRRMRTMTLEERLADEVTPAIPYREPKRLGYGQKVQLPPTGSLRG